VIYLTFVVTTLSVGNLSDVLIWIVTSSNFEMAQVAVRHTIGSTNWHVLKGANGRTIYRVFHRFRQVKFDNGGSVLSLSQFLLLPQLPQK
jgi:hypothetical protein